MAELTRGIDTLSGLADTSVAGPTSGQILVWNGSDWVNQDEQEADRSALAGTAIDFTDAEIRTKTLAANTTFTITNPVQGKLIILELDGSYTVAWPATVTVVNGWYLPDLGTNWAHILCIDSATPAYLVSWAAEV